jgi:hypothetical protein
MAAGGDAETSESPDRTAERKQASFFAFGKNKVTKSRGDWI